MKKNYLLPIFGLIIQFTLFYSTTKAQVPEWVWAARAGDTNSDVGNAIATDVSGNIYVAGSFHYTITFGSFSLPSQGNTDIFLVKYDTLGNVVWAKSFGTDGNDGARFLTFDITGNLYMVGEYENYSITFGAYTLTNAGGSDVFIAKFDVNGNVLWAKGAGGANIDGPSSAVTDAFGNIYVGGSFSYPNITFDTIVLPNTGAYSPFLVKYDSSGNVLWAKTATGTGEFDQTIAVTIDIAGYIYDAGSFQSTSLIFDGDTLINEGIFNLFITKYDENGNLIWARNAGGTRSAGIQSISSDAHGYIYVAGEFGSDTVVLGPDTLIKSGTTIYPDIFIAKYDADGNAIWALSSGGLKDDEPWSIITDTAGNSYVTGFFDSDSISFGNIVLTNTSQNSTDSADIFVVKIDPNGNPLWAISAGGTNYDFASCITADAFGNLYLTGLFESDSILFGVTNLVNAYAGFDDVFIAKLKMCYVTPPVITPSTTIFCQGNPVTLTSDTAASFHWNTGSTNQSITVNSSGVYSVIIPGTGGCTASSTITIDFIQTSFHDTISICQGDTFLFADSTIGTVSMIHSSHLIATNTCDSTIVTVLTVNPVYSQNIATSICYGHVYTFPDSTSITAISDTIQTSHLMTTKFCDSTIITSLTVHPVYNQNVAASICHGSIFTFPNGSDYTALHDTIQTSHLTTIHACDSTIITILTVNALPIPIITPGGSVIICLGDSIALSSSNCSSYLWNTGASTQVIYTDTSGNFQVTITDTNGCSNASAATIVVVDTPIVPTIIHNGSLLVSSSPVNNQWLLNDTAIAGATNFFYNAPFIGCYSLMVTDSNGCKGVSDTVCVTVIRNGINEIETQNSIPLLYPNPNNGTFILRQSGTANYDLRINDAFGRLLYSKSFKDSKREETITFPLSNGIYFWEIVSNDGSAIYESVIEKGKVVIIK